MSEEGKALRERVDLTCKQAQEAQARLHVILHGEQPATKDTSVSDSGRSGNSVAYVAETLDEISRSLASVHMMLDELGNRLG